MQRCRATLMDAATFRGRSMSRRQRRGGGRRRPPDDRLIGCTEAAGILGCNRSTISRLADLGLLKPIRVERDGVRWFDREWMKLLAAHFTLKRLARKPADRGRRQKDATTSVFDATGEYRPELRLRDRSRTDGSKPARRPAPSTSGATPRDVGRAPRGYGPGTQLPPEWWPMDDPPPRSAAPARPESVAQSPAAPAQTRDASPPLGSYRVPEATPPPASTGPAMRAPAPREQPGIGPRTQIPIEWWDGDLSANAPAPEPTPAKGDSVAQDEAPEELSVPGSKREP
jgi:hypothetical protein